MNINYVYTTVSAVDRWRSLGELSNVYMVRTYQTDKRQHVSNRSFVILCVTRTNQQTTNTSSPRECCGECAWCGATSVRWRRSRVRCCEWVDRGAWARTTSGCCRTLNAGELMPQEWLANDWTLHSCRWSVETIFKYGAGSLPEPPGAVARNVRGSLS